MSGNGDTYRPVDPQKWDSEYERIFSPRDHVAHVRPGDVSNARWPLDELTRMAQEDGLYGPHLRHRPEPDTLPQHTQEGHGESDPAERKEIR